MLRAALARPAIGYLAALAGPALMTLGILAIGPATAAPAGYTYLYLAVVILVALGWGMGAAVAAATCAVGFVDYFFVPPRGTLSIAAPADLENLVLFLFAAYVVGALADARRRQAQSLMRANADLERKSAEAEAGRRSAEELTRVSARMDAVAEADRLKTELLANVSHELRSPLAAIVGVSSVLVDPDFRGSLEEMRQHADTINKEGKHLSRLVADLLEMAELEAGGVDLALEPVEALESLYAAAERATNLDGSLNVEVQGESFLLLADDFRLQQVLRNLVENAARYGTRVELRAERGAGVGILAVSDRGPGVPDSQRLVIFERFFRGDAFAAKLGSYGSQGSGLGLAISRKLVESMGGRIWCEGREGGGSTFICQIPLAEG
ncbi:MAG: sensor histidine kinase [Candidatus Dormibacteria bacterium]